MGIPKEFRIKKSNEFSSIRSGGIRRVMPYFITQLKIADVEGSESSQPTRFGLSQVAVLAMQWCVIVASEYLEDFFTSINRCCLWGVN